MPSSGTTASPAPSRSSRPQPSPSLPLSNLLDPQPRHRTRWLGSSGTLTYPAGWTFNRACAGWRFDATGMLVEAAADVPRFDHDPATLACRGLLLKESRTNSIRNPRAEGASPGAPGIMPANWIVSINGGLATQVVGTGSESGIPYLDLWIVGTASTTALLLARFETTTAIAAGYGPPDSYDCEFMVLPAKPDPSLRLTPCHRVDLSVLRAAPAGQRNVAS